MKNKQLIYLDNNATTFLEPKVQEELKELLLKPWGNPSSQHSLGQQARSLLALSRNEVAKILKVAAKDIVFCSGATEALNMLLLGSLDKNAHIISSNVEHSAIESSLKVLEKRGHSVTRLEAGIFGAVQAKDVQSAIREETKLIALMSVNNETGVKTDIAAIAAIAEQRNIPFIVDAVAHFSKEPFSMPKGVKAFCLSGHKFHAPKGVGLAYIHPSFRFKPLIHGGGQEKQKRSGSENLLAIRAMALAMSIAEQGAAAAQEKMLSLRRSFEEKLLQSLEGVMINGEGPRICNTSNLHFEGVAGEALLFALDREGICASHGSACSSGGLQASRILLNMGLGHERALSSLRFSFSKMNSQEEIDNSAEKIIACVKALR